MPMTRRLALLLAIALLIAVSPAFARAQTSVSLAELEIDFWPEYDQAAMLVIYRGTLAPETSFPARVEFGIPARFGPPSAIAFGDSQGQLFDLEHTVRVSGEVMTITFDAPSTYFQFEYYDTSLDLSSPARRYSFATTAPLPIQTLTLQVQQPVGASDMAVTPAVRKSDVGSDGMLYYEASLTNLAANDPISLNLTYNKPTAELSINGLNPVVTPQLPTPSTGPQVDTMMLVIAGIAGALLLGGGVLWLLRSRNPPAELQTEPGAHRRSRARGQPPRPREVRVRAPDSGTALAESSPAVYCHECGTRSQPGDQFCRNCGAQLRR